VNAFFSNCGSFIYSLSLDKSLRIFDSQSLVEIGFYPCEGFPRAMSIATNGIVCLTDELHRIQILEPHGLTFGTPFSYPVRLYRTASASSDTAATINCGHCGCRFSPNLPVHPHSSAVQSISSMNDPSATMPSSSSSASSSSSSSSSFASPPIQAQPSSPSLATSRPPRTSPLLARTSTASSLTSDSSGADILDLFWTKGAQNLLMSRCPNCGQETATVDHPIDDEARKGCIIS